ncbi:T9SS type A sorting domain-containing protein [Gelidibacter maritimus]|uniref:T9SS type A sorting domain-containing protein n=1 Tax=Gelidibacter maritimus TaxID=2761487 RepID=A0A7W2R4T5_9FLAO|nr:T9SS type A sorting domain-containing protein [Gelidibacter maritimus]MBA6153430.1 T9SS type A sorting domain-containing protein [Gelidibacter maritimus]
MAKNYSSWMLLAILFITFNLSFSQTVTFTGSPNDFLPSQKITGDANVDYYVSFDEESKTMYFGAFRTSGTFGADHYFTIYFDADPQIDLTSGIGSTIGMRQHERTPTLPFTANDRFVITNNPSGEKTMHHRRGGRNWGIIPPTEQVVRHTSSVALEIAIKISKLDISTISTKGVYFSMFMASNAGFYGYDNVNYPIKFVSNNSTGYFGGIGVTSKISDPTAHQNTPILHSVINPTTLPLNAKYAYMEFVDNEYDYVTDNIEIVPGGTLLIGPDGTLIIDNLINNGLVSFESNSSQYSGLIANSVGGSGTSQYQRHVNVAGSGSTGRNDLISSPFAGQTFGSFAEDNDNLLSHPTIPTQKGFGPYNKATATYQNYDTVINENTLLESGVGYRAGSKIDGSSLTGGQFLFTGTIVTNNFSVPIAHSSDNYGRWNLIGNPYPSYVDMYELIQLNTPQFDESENYDGIYAYNGNPSNSNISSDIWEVHNLSTTLSGQRDMAPGQGFYVSSKTGGGSFTFTLTSRTPGYGDDFIEFRAAAPIENASLRLTITNNSNSTYTDIYFNNQGTLDHDRGYDSAQIGNPIFTIFSKLVEDSTNRDVPLVIQTLPYSILETEVIVPIGIKASQGEQITISAIDTPAPSPLPETVEVYFEDKVAQTSTLLNTSTLPHNNHHIFTPSTNLTGDMGRFSLRFTNKSLSTNNPVFDALDVYSPLNTGSLIVKGTVNEVTNLEIFDLNGRLVQTFYVQPYQTENRFEVSKMASGIYIIKLNNNTQSKIKKIQLNNKS